jgi:A/G-specific adenine glycosylase
MLQQTQVDRVIPFYEKFLSEFPDVEHLASSSLRSVLICWSGLGYNRRAKYLHETAKKLAGRKLSVRDLESPLPGVGPYTRDAVLALAFNEPRALVETNIRSVFIHHFFPHTRNISDREICAYAKMAAEGQDPRMWHWALMDYGAYLKKLYKNPSRRSAHYTKQSKFEGSLRQVRGAILRELHTGPKTNLKICSLIHAHMEYHTPSSFGRNENKLSFRTLASRHRRIVAMALASLAHDTLIVRERGKWRIA